MEWLDRFRSYAAERREARENARTYRHVRSLPEEIQKDIGWPESAESRRLRNQVGLP